MEISKIGMPNSVDPDEVAHYEHCAQIQLFFFFGILSV